MHSVYKPILSLDFDGVIHSYRSGWKGPRNIPDEAMPGALQFIVEAQEFFNVHIYSTRSRYFGGRRAMRRWLTKEYSKIYTYGNSLPDWFSNKMNWLSFEPALVVFNDAVSDVIKNISFPNHKPPALVTIDDRAIQFKGEWPSVEELLKFKPYKPN